MAGLLITVFAARVIIGPPVMPIATLRPPRRSTLVPAPVVFAVGHVVAALSSDFAVVLASRVVTDLATVVEAHAAGPAATSRALGLLMGGLTVANVIGVPPGSWLGQVSDWRGPLWVLAVLVVRPVGGAITSGLVGCRLAGNAMPARTAVRAGMVRREPLRRRERKPCSPSRNRPHRR
ncbi:MFS transporter [Streptomyces longisporus]|uniref:MFS transporter n=1 Tax=Streptomyces longisporus TaxID=1948 RepID=A0ABP5YF75_STRLO